MKPASRSEFIDYCLRELGEPTLEINVDPSQIEDRVDDAVQKYTEYHYDGTRRSYIPIEVTQQDIANGYIDTPPELIYAVRVLPMVSQYSTVSMFDAKYQMYINDFYALYKAESLQYYEQIQQYLNVLDQLLNGVQTIQFNMRGKRLFIDMKWSDKLNPGKHIMIEGYVTNGEPSAFWNDGWLKKYGVALIKKQWGNNLMKFNNMTLPGGITLNGRQIYEDAVNDINNLERWLQDNAAPLDFYTG